MRPQNHTRPFLIAACLGAAFAGETFAADRVKTANGVVEAAPRSVPACAFSKESRSRSRPSGNCAGENRSRRRTGRGFAAPLSSAPLHAADLANRRLLVPQQSNKRGLPLSERLDAGKVEQGGLPVLVYIFGGGFQNGDGSEPRYDGESMAGKGIVAVTVNYRLNIFDSSPIPS